MSQIMYWLLFTQIESSFIIIIIIIQYIHASSFISIQNVLNLIISYLY